MPPVTESGFGIIVLVVVVLLLAQRREGREGAPEGEAQQGPSLAQVNQVLLFVVLAGVILFALGIIRCEAVIRT